MQSHPLRRMHFFQYQASSAALRWLGYGDCYLMHRMQSGGWPYIKDTLRRHLLFVQLRGRRWACVVDWTVRETFSLRTFFTISGCLVWHNLHTELVYPLPLHLTAELDWSLGTRLYMGVIHAKPWTCVVGRTTDKTSYLSFHWLPITLRYCQAIPKYFSKL